MMLIWLLSYLLGATSPAIWLSKLFGFEDPRQHGSGNPGATNMLRTTNKWLAVITLMVDMAKGFIPVWIGLYLFNIEVAIFSGLFAFIGHCFPIYFNFKGGKGVATAIGCLLALNLYLGFILICLWLMTLKKTKSSALAATISWTIIPIITLLLSADLFFYILILSLAILIRHLPNLIAFVRSASQSKN